MKSQESEARVIKCLTYSKHTTVYNLTVTIATAIEKEATIKGNKVYFTMKLLRQKLLILAEDKQGYIEFFMRKKEREN